MNFDAGIDIQPQINPLDLTYGNDCFGPSVEKRALNDIRKSLLDPVCDGPEIVYAIAMDVGKNHHKDILQENRLLYGVVTYAAGRLGKEPVRSQGHIHKKSTHNGWSPPELYEIWNGKAVIYMQEHVDDFPGRCFAIYADVGDIVLVPPDWAHATISADPESPLTFGAWCDREYGFLYDKIRARKGLAWYPLLDDNDKLLWQANDQYYDSTLIEKTPNDYYELLNIEKGVPIYTQFEKNPELFRFISNPGLKKRYME